MFVDYLHNETCQIVAAYLLGIFFVVFFATRYFNQPLEALEQDFPGKIKQVPEPALPRYMTECARYRLFLGLFIFLTVLLYFFVSLALPQLVVTIYPSLNEPTVVFSVVIGTLAFINVSQKIPFLNVTMVDFKTDLQRRAKIPERAFQVFECLKRGELNTEADVFKKRWRKILTDQKRNRRDIEEDDFKCNKRTLERRWARLTYLIDSLEIWSKEKQFRQHINKPNLNWLKIREHYYEDFRPRFERLRDKTKKIDEVREHNKNTDETKKINQFISQESEKLSEIVDDMLHKVYWLITFLLFMSNRSVEDPRLHLRNIGWIIDTDNYFIFTKNSIVILGISIFISIFSGALIGSVLASVLCSKFNLLIEYSFKANDVLRWLIFGIPMYIIPTIITLVAKRHLSVHEIWPVVHPDHPPPKFSNRPLVTYILVASLSYLITVALLMLIFIFMSMKVEAMQGSITSITGFSLLAFVTSLYISYLIDTPVKESLQSIRFYCSKLIIATLFGLVNVSIIMFFFSLYNNNGDFDFSKMQGQQQGRLLVYSVIGFLNGFCIFISTQFKTIIYERRTGVRDRTDHWITLKLESVTRRAKIITADAGEYKISINDDIKMLINDGDPICIEVDKGNVVNGIINEVREDYLLFREEIGICYGI